MPAYAAAAAPASSREPAATPPPDSVHAWLQEPVAPLHAARRAPAGPGQHGDIVEVSIGAIHLRVDAPAPQTQVHAPQPAAPAPRSPARSAARDAGVRRLLRRI